MSGPYVWAVNGSRKKTAALISLEATRPSDPRRGDTPPGRTLMAASIRAPRYIPLTDRRKLFR